MQVIGGEKNVWENLYLSRAMKGLRFYTHSKPTHQPAMVSWILAEDLRLLHLKGLHDSQQSKTDRGDVQLGPRRCYTWKGFSSHLSISKLRKTIFFFFSRVASNPGRYFVLPQQTNFPFPKGRHYLNCARLFCYTTTFKKRACNNRHQCLCS